MTLLQEVEDGVAEIAKAPEVADSGERWDWGGDHAVDDPVVKALAAFDFGDEL